jgi:hypothetical protein
MFQDATRLVKGTTTSVAAKLDEADLYVHTLAYPDL